MNSSLVFLTLGRLAASVPLMVWAASLPFLLGDWGMSGTDGGAVQSAFNVTFAVSLLATSWLSDHFGAKRVLVVAYALSVVAFVAFAVLARSYGEALFLYALVGLALGGTYTPAIMLVADEVPPRSRGLAMGLLLSGASVGYCVAIVLAAALVPSIGYEWTWVIATAILILGLFASIRAVARLPNRVHRHAPAHHAQPTFAATLVSRRSVLLTAGYTAHNWELLGMWAWAPAFLTFALAGSVDWSAFAIGLMIALVLHLSGVPSLLLGGWLSDRLGRRAILIGMALAGGLLSLVFGWSASLGAAGLLVLAAAYGFATISDSGVLSTAMTESVAPRHLGAMLGLRSILGFGAGAISPLMFGWVLDITNPGDGPPTEWGWAFALLGAGGLAAALFAALLPKDHPPSHSAPPIPTGGTAR